MPQKEFSIFDTRIGKQDLVLKRQAEATQHFLDANTRAETEQLKKLEEAHNKSDSLFTINTGFFDPKNQKTQSL